MDQAEDLAEGRARIEKQRAIIARLEQLRIESAQHETARSQQAPIFLPTASDGGHDADIQAAAIGGAYGADHYHDDVPWPRWRGNLVVAMAVLALATLGTVGTFAYSVMFGGYVFPSLPSIVKAGIEPDNIVRNNSDNGRNDFEPNVPNERWCERKTHPTRAAADRYSGSAENGTARHFRNPHCLQTKRPTAEHRRICGSGPACTSCYCGRS